MRTLRARCGYRNALALASFLASLLLYIGGSQTAAGQVASLRVGMQSPTAAALGEYGEVPVSLYTGTPDIAIPLFKVEGRALSLPIALRYHAGGVRVDEIGGWVGLGWSLEAGGVITRTVRGIQDELPKGYYHTGGAFDDEADWLTPPSALLEDVAEEDVDGEPDQFFFNFAGRSGRFALAPEDGSGPVAHAIPYQKLDIRPVNLDGPDGITGWVVVAEDGTRYTFAAAEVTTDYNRTRPEGGEPARFGESYTSAWYLTEIQAPASEDRITLEYEPYTARHELRTYEESVHFQSGACALPQEKEILNRYELAGRRLRRITSARHVVTFAHALREDARSAEPPPGTLWTGGQQQEPLLDAVTVSTPSGSLLRTFDLEHGYFGSGPAKRLRLDRLTEVGRHGEALPPYIFTYDEQALPPRSSSDVDHWGFYNGATNGGTRLPELLVNGVGLDGADRSPSAAHMMAGSLKQITYPTGGQTTFTFEPHDYAAMSEGGPVYVESETPRSIPTLSASSFGSSRGTLTIDGDAAARVVVNVEMTVPDGPEDDRSHVRIEDENRTEFIREPGWHTLHLEPGTYEVEVRDFVGEGEVSAAIHWYEVFEVEEAPEQAKTAGGLRVAAIESDDGRGGTVVQTFRYRTAADDDRSSGVVLREPAYGYWYDDGSCSYYSRSSMSLAPLGLAQGSPVGYGEVEVRYGADGEGGVARHHFRTATEAPDGGVLYERWPFATRTSYDWKRGQRTRQVALRLRQTDEGVVREPARETATAYAFRDEEGDAAGAATTRAFRALSLKAFAGASGRPAYVYNPYEVISAWTHPRSETVTTYGAGGRATSATRTYHHEDAEHLQLTRLEETGSGGLARTTTYDYAHERYPAMADEHMLAQVYRTTVRAGGAAGPVEQRSWTAWALLGGRWRPASAWAWTGEGGAPNGHDDPGTTRQAAYEAYDDFGRLRRQRDARATLTTFAYGGEGAPAANGDAYLTAVEAPEAAPALGVRYGYDDLGRLIRVTGEDGNHGCFNYDDLSRLSGTRHVPKRAEDAVSPVGACQEPGTEIASYAYEYTSGNIATDPNAVRTTRYGGESPDGEAVTFLDGLGRPIQTQTRDEGDRWVITRTDYDGQGRPSKVWKPVRHATGGGFLDPGEVEDEARNRYGDEPYTETLYEASPLGRVVEVVHPGGGASIETAYGVEALTLPWATASYGYRFTETTDEEGRQTRTYADALGRAVLTRRQLEGEWAPVSRDVPASAESGGVRAGRRPNRPRRGAEDLLRPLRPGRRVVGLGLDPGG